MKKDPSLKDFPPVDEYLAQLDLNKIADAILATEGRPVTEEDFEDAKRMIWEGAENWLVQDIHDLQIIGIEVPYEPTLILPGGREQRVKAFMDIVGIVRGRLNSTAKHAGKKVIIDWKTTSNLTLDAKWKERYIESWQGRIYDLLEPSELVNFRGLSRGGAFADIFLEFSPESRPEVENQILGVSLQRAALVNSGLTIWPQAKPSACHAYGRDCPYKPSCPSEPGLVPADKSLSYSSMSTFMLCPERYRRNVMESLADPDADVDGSDESNFGSACHRGLAELYRQVAEKFN